ncbi:hypothetical protein FRC17_003565 [Serendipita sp. 399]|nr:hypothetical protein FRC17_003565 [Serendipita sp. 399]
MSTSTVQVTTIAALAEKRRQLEECDANIARLKEQIQVAKARRALQQRLEAATKTPYANMGFPSPVLNRIFEYYVANNSMGIRRLYTICKGWKTLIDDSRHLWAIIYVQVPSKAVDIEACQLYCASCIKNSGENPLSVTIDYTAATLPFSHVLYEHLLDPLQKLSDDPEYRRNLDFWLLRRCKSGGRDFYDTYQTYFFQPVATLAGSDGAHMQRWKTFTILGKQTAEGLFLMDALSKYLRWPAPLLEKIEIVNLGKFVTKWDNQNRIFPKLPLLRQLSLNYAHLPLDAIEIDESRMETLQLTWLNNEEALARILRCRNLRALSFAMAHEWSEEKIRELVRFEETQPSFPDLVELQVGGSIPSLFWSHVGLAAVQDLTFSDQYPTSNLFKAIGTFTLPNVTRITFVGPPVRAPTTLKDALRALLLACPVLKAVRALGKYSEEILTSLRELKEEGVDVSSLTTLFIKERRVDAGYHQSINLALDLRQNALAGHESCARLDVITLSILDIVEFLGF